MIWCQKCGPYCWVMDGSMMLCNIISQISGAWSSVVKELASSCSAAEPVEFHVRGFEYQISLSKLPKSTMVEQ